MFSLKCNFLPTNYNKVGFFSVWLLRFGFVCWRISNTLLLLLLLFVAWSWSTSKLSTDRLYLILTHILVQRIYFMMRSNSPPFFHCQWQRIKFNIYLFDVAFPLSAFDGCDFHLKGKKYIIFYSFQLFKCFQVDFCCCEAIPNWSSHLGSLRRVFFCCARCCCSWNYKMCVLLSSLSAMSLVNVLIVEKHPTCSAWSGDMGVCCKLSHTQT